MHAVTYLPSRALAPYIKRFWEIRHHLAPDETIAVPFGCTGSCHFVFCLESAFKCCKLEGTPMEVCESTLFVQNSLPYTKYFRGPTLGLVIDFTPIGLHTLWQVPVHELRERSLDLTAVINYGVRDLPDQLREAPSTTARFTLLENFFLRRLAYVQRLKQPASYKSIEAAVACIQQQPGHIHLPQLAHYVNCSERTFRRRFTEIVGLSPKFYVRIQRFMHTRQWIEQHPRSDWQRILSLMEYYDQAHLINEFHYFTGKSPVAYREEPAGLHNILFT